LLQLNPSQVVSVIAAGGVIAYPTEAVYGLGCDPDNDKAIEKLLQVKQRPWQKGLILVAANYAQLRPYIDESKLTATQLQSVFAKWPGPFTFIMPINPGISKLLCGRFNSLAVRVSAHAGIQAICNAIGKPLVSTSANLSGQEPAMSVDEILITFNSKIDAVVSGELGVEGKPSTITDVLTSKILR